MKKFYYVTDGKDLIIHQSVGGQAKSDAISLSGKRIYYIDEDKVNNIQMGTNYVTGTAFSQVSVFGNAAFNMLNDRIVVDSIISTVASGTTDTKWYLVSSITTDPASVAYQNNLAYYGTMGIFGTSAIIELKYLQPFTDLEITVGTLGNYRWNTVQSTNQRWKKLS